MQTMKITKITNLNKTGVVRTLHVKNNHTFLTSNGIVTHNCGDSNELMCLQAILEGKPFFVKGMNSIITPHKEFCIIATDNTKGRGDDSGRHIGTNMLNDAFLERFQMTMVQGYPDEKTEKKIFKKLMSNIGLDDDTFLVSLVKWTQSIRKTYVDDGLDEQITTRRACHIIAVYKMIKDADKAIELCVNRFDVTTTAAMMSLWKMLKTEK